MAVSFNSNPDDYAAQYAAQNNLDVDTAKAELKAKYGDPVQPNGSNNNNIDAFNYGAQKNQNNTNLDPDVFAQMYADIKGITLDAAKEELKSSIGEPTKPEDSSNSSSDSTTISDLPDADIDPDEFAQTYADEHGLTLGEAKAKLKDLYGVPTQQDQNGTNNKKGKGFFTNIFGIFR